MDENVKHKQSQALLAAQGPSLSYPLLQQPLPLELGKPPTPGGYLSPRHSSQQQDEVLDLTYSPPSDSLPDLAEASAALSFWTEPGPQPQLNPLLPLPFPFSPAFDGMDLPGSGPLCPSSQLHEHLPQPPAQPPPLPDHFAQPDPDINYKALLEEMLSSLNVGPQDTAQDRQSVIQFSGLSNF